jgi:ATP-binding cassette subfamily F protein 3
VFFPLDFDEIMLTAHKISKSFGIEWILKEVTFSINPGERVGLIGPNGCGKSTLLHILIGDEIPDHGHISLSPSDLRIGYLSQGFEPEPGITIDQLVRKTLGDVNSIEAEIVRLASALAENPNQPALQSAYDTNLHRLEELSRHGNRKTQSIFASLGLADIPAEAPIKTLSGGQKTRLGLALLILGDPQLLLLDEPTNHLDIAMLEWLEGWLQSFQGGALIVSHDRTFLDNTVNRILDLDPLEHKVKAYSGDYSSYLTQVLKERESQINAYRDQMAEIRRLKQDIVRLKSQARSTERGTIDSSQRRYAMKVARKAKSREKKLKRFLDSEDRVDKPKSGWQMKLEFEDPETQSKDVLIINDLSVGYPDHPPLLENVNAYIRSGQRIAFTGPNGSGKTTLLRTIASHIQPIAGQIRIGANVKLGYMSQEQELLDLELTAVETIQRVASFNETETRSFLHYYLFAGDDPLRPTRNLSYGERSRLMLAVLVAQGCNLLLLDEPINHLDIPSRERFEQALHGYTGTVLAVVHDRYFIKRFATDVWIIEDRGVRRQ